MLQKYSLETSAKLAVFFNFEKNNFYESLIMNSHCLSKLFSLHSFQQEKRGKVVCFAVSIVRVKRLKAFGAGR